MAGRLTMRRGSLAVLAAVFFVAFVGRAIVLASEAARPESAGPALHEEASACLGEPLAASLRQTIDGLEAREKTLVDREQRVKIFETEIEKRLVQLEAANARFAEAAARVKAAEDADVARLAAIYEGMKPREAGAIVDEMDPKFAAGLLAAMNPQAAAQIVAHMDSKKAYSLSVLLAARSRDAAGL
jgi:flagellar motility protein MotE (MotC chaperone)